MRYKFNTRVSRSTYTHQIQPLRIRPIEPMASESVGKPLCTSDLSTCERTKGSLALCLVTAWSPGGLLETPPRWHMKILLWSEAKSSPI